MRTNTYFPPQPEHLTHPKYRPDIDGLRAIAVLSVVIFHAFPKFIRGGFIGVDIFFVISGFLISTIIMDSLERNSFSFLEFYSRRIKRIFPALLLVLIASFVFGWFALLADEYKQLGKHIAGGAGFVSNFLFWNESGYFDNTAETKPLLHLWSLGIEEQFYIIWPLLLWLAWKRRFNLLTITIVVTVISFVLNIGKVHSDAVAAFYSPYTRFWELLMGSSLAYMTLHKRSLFPKFKHKLDIWLGQIVNSLAPKANSKTLHNVQSVLGAVLILTGLLVITKERNFPGWWAILPTLGAVLIISAGMQAWFNRIVLSNRVLVWFGLISFPLYLWHWPLLSFTRIIESETPSRQIRIAAVLVSIALAWLTYRLIERPIRFGKHSKVKTIILFVLMVVVGYVGYNSFERGGLEFRKISRKASDFIYKTDNLGYLRCPVGELLNDITLNYCLVSHKGNINAALLGDSHAEDKFHGISKIDKNRNWMLIGNSSCPPVYGISVEGDQKGCQERFEKIIKWIAKSNDIKTVALSFYGNYFLTTSYAADHIKNKLGPQNIKITSSDLMLKTRSDIFYSGLHNAIDILEKKQIKIILTIDIPELPFFPRDCYRNDNNCQLTKNEVKSRQLELRALIAKLKQQHPSLLIFDPIQIFCPNELCIFQDSKQILYRDSHHLTLRGSDIYAKYFINWLNIH